MTAGSASGHSARNRVGDLPTLGAEARTWPAVLDALEGEVQEAEESLARGPAVEIAAWGRRHGVW